MIGLARLCVRGVLLLAAVVILFPFAAAGRLLGALGAPAASARFGGRIQRLWARVSLRLAGVRLELEGPADGAVGPALVCANHRGYLDILVLGAVFPGRFVAMREIHGWPLVGWMARSTGTLFLRREDLRELPRATARVGETLAAGVPVLLFPEGRAGPGDRLMPFRSPLFKAAAEGRAPCLAVALEYATPGTAWSTAWTVAWWGEMGLWSHLARLLCLPGVVARVRVLGEPVVDRDRKALAAELEARLTAALEPVSLDPEPPDNPWKGMRPQGPLPVGTINDMSTSTAPPAERARER